MIATESACHVQAAGSGLRASSLLLASHNTPGARAAEEAAFKLLAPGGRLHHLVIVPELWQGMSGDGWRINAITEHEFCDYLEGQIERETLEHLKCVADIAVRRGIAYSAASEFGSLEACLTAAAAKGDYDALIMGSPRPKRTPGLRSRVSIEKVSRALTIPLIIVPHPDSQRA